MAPKVMYIAPDVKNARQMGKTATHAALLKPAKDSNAEMRNFLRRKGRR